MWKVVVASAGLVIFAGTAGWAADDDTPVAPPSAPDSTGSVDGAAPVTAPNAPAAAPEAAPEAQPMTGPEGTPAAAPQAAPEAAPEAAPATGAEETSPPAPASKTATPGGPMAPGQESVPSAPTPGAPVDVTRPPANTRPPTINVNPAPPALPPLRRAPDANAAAMSGAVVAKVPIAPLPPLSARAPAPRPRLSDIGWGAFVGGGYEDFTNGTARGMTSPGGAWDARIIGGTRYFLGFEAAYVGSARNIEALGLATNSSLVSNGFEGAMRVNVPVVRARSLYEPFGFVGLGYSHYSVTNYNAAASSDVASGDGVMTLPFGAGFAYGYKAFMADARVNYTPTFYNNLFQATNSSSSLTHWGFGGNLGVAF